MNLSGSPLDFLLAFFGGVLVSFTPCVYPLLPVTMSYIGASGAKSRGRSFTLSLVYVGGISITYAILGLIAVLTGSIFGKFSSLPLVRIVAGLIIVLFGINLWSEQGLRLPLPKIPILNKPGNHLSCFILGLTSGLVVSPCTAPALGSILTIVATTKNYLHGALLLFSFAYGMGLLLILAGTFSSILTALPKSGGWMKIINKAFAIILIVVGVYFVVSGVVNLAYAQDVEFVQSGVDFSLRDMKGYKITLSEFRNKKSIVLLFWTTWCPFCRSEFNKLSQIYPTLMSDGIEVLAINIEESERKIKRFLESEVIVFPVLLDRDAAVANTYGLVGVPTFILINNAGRIVFKDHYFPQNTYRELLTDR
jgi:cytochrome c-type biogenesis protein